MMTTVKTTATQTVSDEFDAAEANAPYSVAPALTLALNAAVTDLRILDAREQSLSAQGLKVLDLWQRRYAHLGGRAAQSTLRSRFVEGLAWVDEHYDAQRGRYWQLATVVLRKVFDQFLHDCRGKRGLYVEREDEKRRDRAWSSDEALWEYHAYVIHRLERRRRAGRCRGVPGLNPEELIERAALALVEVALGGPDAFERYERPGYEATVVYFDRFCRRLRKQRKIVIVQAPEEIARELEKMKEHAPSPLSNVIAREREQRLTKLFADVRGELSGCQRQWLDAMVQDVGAHGRLNLARVAQMRGKDRSSAQRARRAIKTALRVLKADDLLD